MRAHSKGIVKKATGEGINCYRVAMFRLPSGTLDIESLHRQERNDGKRATLARVKMLEG